MKYTFVLAMLAGADAALIHHAPVSSLAQLGDEPVSGSGLKQNKPICTSFVSFNCIEPSELIQLQSEELPTIDAPEKSDKKVKEEDFEYKSPTLREKPISAEEVEHKICNGYNSPCH